MEDKNTAGRELILIYDTAQVPALLSALQKGEGRPLVASLDAQVDMLLRENHVQFISARDYKTKSSEWFSLSEEWASRMESEEWNWFAYRAISLAVLFKVTLQGYFLECLYYVDIFTAILAEHTDVSGIAVFAPTQAVPVSGARIARHEIAIVRDCAQLVGEQRGIAVRMLGELRLVPPTRHAFIFRIQKHLFVAVFAVLNTVMSLRKRRPIRILASDYWRHIEPMLKELPDSEVILLDRKESAEAGLQNIWRYKMRFLHADRFDSRERQALRAKSFEEHQRQWSTLTARLTAGYIYKGITLEPLLRQLLDDLLIEQVPQLLEEIDDSYAMIEALKPDAVLLRATISRQLHFAILARVAATYGIPSIEMQHGIEYYGAGSFERGNHAAQYTGVYGPFIEREMLTYSKKDSVPVIIGSPRFDGYAQLPAKKEEAGKEESVSVVCFAPATHPGTWMDTYEIEDYFTALGRALRGLPHVSLVVKLRRGRQRGSFYDAVMAEAFKGISYRVTDDEPLTSLLANADIAVSHYSTTMLEALQCGKTSVFLGLSPEQKCMGEHHFGAYAKEGALVMATTPETLEEGLSLLVASAKARADIAGRAAAFMRREYVFDGKASLRAAAFIRNLVLSRKKDNTISAL